MVLLPRAEEYKLGGGLPSNRFEPCLDYSETYGFSGVELEPELEKL